MAIAAVDFEGLTSRQAEDEHQGAERDGDQGQGAAQTGQASLQRSDLDAGVHSSAMRPSALEPPVRVTTATPRPLTTTLPADNESPAESLRGADLPTATDSPVSADSSTSSDSASRNSQSAGMMSPSPSKDDVVRHELTERHQGLDPVAAHPDVRRAETGPTP